MMGASLPARFDSAPVFCAVRLERVFAQCFLQAFNTRLVGGAAEPLYEPAGRAGHCHLLHYREDYFASALHETAHWCIAGARRRRLLDFGYWYTPDGRSAAQQRAFEAVEYRPQAMEWHFARACGYRFRISMDNLSAVDSGPGEHAAFKRRVLQQARHWQATGLPQRAERFARALRREFEREGEEPDFDLAGLN